MRTSLVLATALVALSTAPAFSQPAPEQGGGPPRQWEHEGRGPGRPEHRREAMGRAMKAILQLRPDQEGAFATFEAAMTPPARGGRDHSGPRDGQGGETLTTPQRVDRGIERMQAHLEKARARGAAVKTFYAALTPEQQRAFDALARMHGPMHEGRGRMGAMGAGPHGPPDSMGGRSGEGF